MNLGSVRRAGTVVALAVAATALGVTAANAQAVTSGTFSVTGDPGDYITEGQSYAYSTASNDTLTVAGSTDDSHIEVEVEAANGDNWELDLAAPQGQALAAGTYDNATRYPFQSPSVPGLSLIGQYRGCNTVTGSFVVQDVVFGPSGYVQTLDATFEQHCEGADAAARGEVHIANAPAPPVLGVGLTVATNGTATKLDGNAELTGTVSCNEPVSVKLTGQLTEVVHKVIIRGDYSATVACTPGAAGVPWSATAVPTDTTPFQKGEAEALSTATATDPTYGQTVTTNNTTVVTLTAVKKP
jgi:hypothetical protein